MYESYRGAVMSRVVKPEDIYVVHTIPGQEKQVFRDARQAYKAFTQATKERKHISIAMWRGPRWAKLHQTEAYPEYLSEPYLNRVV
jgi:hypothetical protein